MRTLAPLLLSVLLAAACGGAAVPPPARSPAAEAASSTAAVTAAASPPLAATPPAPAAVPSASPGAAATPSSAAPVGARIDHHDLRLDAGDVGGAALTAGGVAIAGGTTGTWTSSWYAPGFAFTRLVPSWAADTTGAAFIRVLLQARTASGDETAWYSFGVWAYDDASVPRSSSDGQHDRFGHVETDTYVAAVPLAAYRLRVQLFRPTASAATPLLRSIGAVASDPTSLTIVTPCSAGSCPLRGVGKDLAVPAYSQELHAGEFPQFDGGGEAWCSPTSTAMVLAYWRSGPSPADLWWVPSGDADRAVDSAARYTYDAAYGGTGNWPFNTAYAAHFGVRAFVTQLRSLGEAERFIAAGIPLVASVKVAPGALPGFPIPQGTDGHLLVIRGFTPEGDVIANDPAAPSDAAVRRVYPRAAFERAWIGGSNGTVYVIHPSTVSAPVQVRGATPNW
ncbi:MAG: peptidase C39 family protein [Chloroflexota bacterium]|nr:peptidase C39 family protein [Chloroflexota bacterium]MDE3192936.1 peptidase C39 family protein [Chloroflexota bacterium]